MCKTRDKTKKRSNGTAGEAGLGLWEKRVGHRWAMVRLDKKGMIMEEEKTGYSNELKAI